MQLLSDILLLFYTFLWLSILYIKISTHKNPKQKGRTVRKSLKSILADVSKMVLSAINSKSC